MTRSPSSTGTITALLGLLIFSASAIAQSGGAFAIRCDARTPISSLPHTISKPGSYYVTRDLLGAAGSSGITISADDVTIDLNGFALRGVPNSQHGIVVPLKQTSISVINGTITSWSGDGIRAQTTSNSLYQDLRVQGNGGSGIHGWNQCVVRACGFQSNALAGLILGLGNLVSECTAQGNQASGFSVATGSTFSHCTSTSNGAFGFSMGDRSTTTSCTAALNTGHGFLAALHCTISDSTASGNQGHGIHLSGNGSIGGCSATDNGDTGLSSFGGTIIRNCTSSLNTVGIAGGNGSSILSCTVQGNDNLGIEVSHDSLIRDNNCSSNGSRTGVGISVLGSDNRIDANNVTDHWTCVLVSGTGNVIIRNSASGAQFNLYDIATGNSVGPIGSADTASSPWANLIF